MGKGEIWEIQGQNEEGSVAQSFPLFTCEANTPHPSSAEKLLASQSCGFSSSHVSL